MDLNGAPDGPVRCCSFIPPPPPCFIPHSLGDSNPTSACWPVFRRKVPASTWTFIALPQLMLFHPLHLPCSETCYLSACILHQGVWAFCCSHVLVQVEGPVPPMHSVHPSHLQILEPCLEDIFKHLLRAAWEYAHRLLWCLVRRWMSSAPDLASSLKGTP